LGLVNDGEKFGAFLGGVHREALPVAGAPQK
jgi:hypothetical protein